MNFTKQITDEYYSKTYSDDNRSHQYLAPNFLPDSPSPKIPFDTQPPTLSETMKVCWRKSNTSAPGMNGISYLVYKRCPNLLKFLHKFFIRVWKSRKIPISWQIARIKLLVKGSDVSHPSLMRPISILNVEGRLFFTIYQQRLSAYLLNNDYIQRKVQNFLDGVAGCIEHTTLTYEALKKCKIPQTFYLCFVDLNNAYGSVRHMQLQFALPRFHVPV